MGITKELASFKKCTKLPQMWITKSFWNANYAIDFWQDRGAKICWLGNNNNLLLHQYNLLPRRVLWWAVCLHLDIRGLSACQIWWRIPNTRAIESKEKTNGRIGARNVKRARIRKLRSRKERDRARAGIKKEKEKE